MFFCILSILALRHSAWCQRISPPATTADGCTDLFAPGVPACLALEAEACDSSGFVQISKGIRTRVPAIVTRASKVALASSRTWRGASHENGPRNKSSVKSAVIAMQTEFKNARVHTMDAPNAFLLCTVAAIVCVLTLTFGSWMIEGFQHDLEHQAEMKAAKVAKEEKWALTHGRAWAPHKPGVVEEALPAVCHKLLVRSADYPLSVPLQPLIDGGAWTIDIRGVHHHAPIFTARLSEETDKHHTTLTLWEYGHHGRPLAAMDATWNLRDHYGHHVGRFENQDGDYALIEDHPRRFQWMLRRFKDGFVVVLQTPRPRPPSWVDALSPAKAIAQKVHAAAAKKAKKVSRREGWFSFSRGGTQDQKEDDNEPPVADAAPAEIAPEVDAYCGRVIASLTRSKRDGAHWEYMSSSGNDAALTLLAALGVAAFDGHRFT